jgi:predicted acylesterase/phospholipase RssA
MLHLSVRAVAAAIAIAAALPALPAAPAPGHHAASFTISGGAALGSYEAGFLYYMLAAGQVNGGGGLDLRLATGASAGSINSLLALVHAEGGLPLDPDQSLFARVWLPMGFHQLFQPGTATALGAFSRQALLQDAKRVEEAFRAGLPASLDVVLAVAVTRVTPRQRRIAAGRASVPRTEEKFIVRIRGRGPGHMPRITNYASEGLEEEQALLPEDENGEIAFDRLASLLVASAAFPVAFAPEKLAHCMVSTRGKSRPFCPASAAREDLFVDGGVFDNAPLRVAAWIAAGGLRPVDGRLRWLDAPVYDDPRPPRDVDFAFLSAEARAYPTESEARRAESDGGLPSLVEEELASFVATARSKELDTLVSEYPAVTNGLLFAQRHVPAASEPMLAFFGFFERSFRSFDFALGMYEARRQLRKNPLARVQDHPGSTRFVLPEESTGARENAAAWAPLACLDAVLDREGDPAVACAGEGLSSLRIVLQTSLDRLWNACQAFPASGADAAAYPACSRTVGRDLAPRVPGVPAPSGSTLRGASESETEYVVRLLADYGFDWTDMGYGRADAAHALVGIRGELQAVSRTLARRQPTLAARSTVQAATNLAVDTVHYLPPRSALWVTFGRALEVGGGVAVVDTLWLRLSGAVKLQNLLTAVSSDPTSISLLPVAGVEVVPAAIGTSVVQPSFLLRGGYLFDLNDEGCGGSAGDSIGECSRPEVEIGAAVVIASLLRIQFLVEWYPAARGARGLWGLAPSMGFQVGF